MVALWLASYVNMLMFGGAKVMKVEKQRAN